MKVTKRQQITAAHWFFNMIRAAKGSAYERKKANITFYSEHPKEPFIGGMFFFYYDAKHKDKLPYWDKFPLVIPIETYADGFLGLNLHYLPPQLRTLMINKLSTYKKKSDSKVFMNLSYKLLKAAIRSQLFQPCVKRYLTNHIRSELVMVSHQEWVTAAMLPLQQFQKVGARDVWKLEQKRVK